MKDHPVRLAPTDPAMVPVSAREEQLLGPEAMSAAEYAAVRRAQRRGLPVPGTAVNDPEQSC